MFGPYATSLYGCPAIDIKKKLRILRSYITIVCLSRQKGKKKQKNITCQVSGSHRFYRWYRDVNLTMQWHDQSAACARKCTLNLCAAESASCLSPPPKRQVAVLAHGAWDVCDIFTFAWHKKKFIKLISVHGWAMECVTNCHCEEKKEKKNPGAHTSLC